MDDQVEPMTGSESELDISLEIFPEALIDDKKNLEQLLLTGIKIDCNNAFENNESPMLEEDATNIVKTEPIGESKGGIIVVGVERSETNITVQKKEGDYIASSDENLDSKVVNGASQLLVDSRCDFSNGIASSSQSESQKGMVKERKKPKGKENLGTSHSEKNDESESDSEEMIPAKRARKRFKKRLNTGAEEGRSNSKSKNQDDDLRPRSSTMNNKKGPAENATIKKLKRYLSTAGIRVKYNQLWSGCEGHTQRAQRMRQLLSEKGMKGRPTLKKCRRLKSSNELKYESAELNPQNIISEAPYQAYFY